MEILALLLFISIFFLILYGYPVAFTLGGLSLIYGVCFLPHDVVSLLPIRIGGIMAKEELIAVPLFVFMGIMLEKSGLAIASRHCLRRRFLSRRRVSLSQSRTNRARLRVES